VSGAILNAAGQTVVDECKNLGTQHEIGILCIPWVAVAQEVRVVVWQQEGRWFDPRAPPSYVSRCP